MRIVLGTLPQMFVMAAIVATALLFPLLGILFLVAFIAFGVSLHAFVTFGEHVSAVDGLVLWWGIMLIPVLAYAAYVMPWTPKD